MYETIFIIALLPMFVFGFDDILSFFQPDIKNVFGDKHNMDDIRIDAQNLLEQDLMEWEAMWSAFSPRESFSRFVEDKPPQVQKVFWDSFGYTESKVKAGRTAYANAMQDGASIEEARQAYFNAAKMPRNELIKMNEQFNIKHGLANIEEQRLFENGRYIYRTEQ